MGGRPAPTAARPHRKAGIHAAGLDGVVQQVGQALLKPARADHVAEGEEGSVGEILGKVTTSVT